MCQQAVSLYGSGNNVAMQFYEGCSDGTFEMDEDWLVECTICRHRYRIDRCSLHISVMKQSYIFVHYFWAELICRECVEKLLVRTKVYRNETGGFMREDHECDAFDFIKPPDIRLVNHPKFQNNLECPIKQ